MDANVECGAQNVKATNLEKKSKTETNFSSFGVDNPGKMIVIGKGITQNKSRSVNSKHRIHECQSDTAVSDNDQHKDSFTNEGFKIGLSENSSISALSFTSAKSNISTIEALQEKLYNMECEISGKNATISSLKKQLNKGDEIINYNTVAVETHDEQSGTYKLELADLQIKISNHEKTITKLSKELEENIKIKRKYIEENQNLVYEVNYLNNQLHSMYDFMKSTNWDTGLDPEEYKECKTKIIELQLELKKKEEIVNRLEENIVEKENLIKLKEELFEETAKKFSEYRTCSSLQITDLTGKICSLENEAKIQEEIFNDKISKAQKNMADKEIISITQKLEMQYQEKIKTATARYKNSYKILSEMPESLLNNLIRLCEKGKFDITALKKDWEEEKLLFEKKIVLFQEEKDKEITGLVNDYESKIRNLMSEIESLNMQLEEHKETMETFENEFHGNNTSKEQNGIRHYHSKGSQTYEAEIISKEENQNEGIMLLKDEMKSLSEGIFDVNKKAHPQKLRSTKLLVANFKGKQKELSAKLEEKVKSKKALHEAVVFNKIDLESSLNTVKELTVSLKKVENVQDEKIKFLKTLDQKETMMHEKEMNLSKSKLDNVSCFQFRLFELDTEIKELVKIVEEKYRNTIQTLTSCHYSEIKLNQLEFDSNEQHNVEEAMKLKERIRELEQSKESLENKIHLKTINFEKEMQALKSQTEDIAVELLKSEGMLAVKMEIEDTLVQRVSQLEGLLAFEEDNFQESLGNAISKCIAIEAFLSAEMEIADECKIMKNENISKESHEHIDNTENVYSKVEESFKKMECLYKMIYDMRNSENYPVLRDKFDFLISEFSEMHEQLKYLKDEFDKLSKAHVKLVIEKDHLSRNYHKVKGERHQILINYKLLEDDIRKFASRHNDIEYLHKMMNVNNVIRTNFRGVRDANYGDGKDVHQSVCTSDILNEFNENFSEKGNQEHERQRCADESMGNEKDEVAETELPLQEKWNMKRTNEILKRSITVLNERLDNLTNITNLDEMRGENQILICNMKRDAAVVYQKFDTIRKDVQRSVLSEDEDILKSEDTELKLKVDEMEKNKCITIRGRGNFLREEMIAKLENISDKICELMKEKNIIVDNFKNLSEERKKLKTELEELRSANKQLRSKFDAELKEMSEQTYTVLTEELSSKELKVSEMKKEIRKLNDCMKTLGYELDLVEINNENVLSESHHQMKSNQSLKDELEEAWSQRYEVEDELMKLRKENAVLNFHRDQLEQTNEKISRLLSEAAPSVVSWSHIHETMEKIIDVVHALKTSFKDLNPTLIGSWKLFSSKSKPKSDFRSLPELHVELQNKTKLCKELVLQKNMLERELESLEIFMKQSTKIRKQKTENLDEGSTEKVDRCSEDPNDQIPLLEENVQVEDDILLRCANYEENAKTDPLKKDYYKEEIHCDHDIELEKLRDILKEVQETGSTSLLLHEIESKHTEEMEELRRYFEQKCAELEKSYSEEIFSQHSLKIYSDSDITENVAPEDIDAMKDVKLGDFDNKEDIVEKYRAVLDQEEEDTEKKLKFLKYITEIVNVHVEELNCMKTKHAKEKANLQKRHMLELKKLNEDLLITKKTAEFEKELLVKSYENLMNEIKIEERRIIAVDLGKELENRIKTEIRNFSKLLQAEKLALEKETMNLEELFVEKLSAYETEWALKKVETEKELERKISKRNEENFRKKLEEEKVKIAQHYKELNEAVLQKCNEEQENLIRSHSEITHKLIKDHEERISELKKAHKQDLEKLYCDEELKKLSIEFRNREKKFENEISSIKTSYEDELYELKKSCQETLNEQVNLAKVDAFNTLQKQIQSYLEGDDQNLSPSKEVVELSEKFVGKYRREIKELKEKHHGEVTRIRSEYEEKIKRRYSTGSLPRKSMEKMEMRTDDDKLQILRERDALQEMVSSLRHILSELIRYVGSCEDELNSTIIGEFGKSEETLYRSFRMDTSELNETSSSILSKKVHFAPDLSNIISDVNDSKSLNTSLQVRMELDRCLKQLKSDASHLLALSNPGRRHDENMYELLKKMEEEKNSLTEKVICVEEMQKSLKMELNKTKNKLTELERSRETISEGYGEVVNSEEKKTLIPFKEKAKALMLQNCNSSSDVLSLVEEICQEGDRLQDEVRREKNDLQQQVVAAEKQLRSMKKFLEEQAAERESERDEYMSEIDNLKETLKIRERDKSLQDRMNQEVQLAVKRNLIRMETLETQLKEANVRTTQIQQDKTFVENQLKEAVGKIWTLRDIITNLEEQVATISMRETQLHCKLKELEKINHQHVKINEDLVVELEAVKTKTQDEYSEHIKTMEEELSNLRHATERLSTEAVCQMRVNLREIELSLSKKTKDLEQLYMSSANVSCSSPSEDISICDRLDATGCPTPDEMQNSGETQKMVLPLEEINRIHEKLTRHTRAEEIIIKMIKDLEMQLKNNKKGFEEVRNERDVLLERVNNYLQENSRLKIRLDEQRCSATLIQKQLNADLEDQIKRLELDIEKLNDLCNQKDKQLRDITSILDQTTKSLKIREKEALNKSNEENELIINLKAELHNALDENKKLEKNMKKMKETIRETVTVPLLLDKMLEEKNAEIDRLEKEVSNLSKIRATSSLIRSTSSTDSKGSSIKSMKRVKFSKPDSFVQFISPILPEDQSVLRCGSDSYADLKISSFKLRKSGNWTTPESLSSIGALQLSPRGHDSSMPWNDNHFVLMSSPKEENKKEVDENVVPLQKETSQSTAETKKYESELSERDIVDAEIDEIRDQLNKMMAAVEQDKVLYKKEFEKMLQNESRLQAEIDSKRQEISEHLLEVDTLKRKLAEVNLDLGTVKSEYQRLENEMHDKEDEIRKGNNKIENFLITIETLKRNHLEEVEELQNKLNFEHNRVESVLDELKILEVKKVEIEVEFLSLKEDYNEKLNSEQETVMNLKSEINDLRRKNKQANVKYEELESLMENTLREANKLSQDLTEELSKMKSENEKLKTDYLVLKSNLDSCINQIVDKKDIEIQVELENSSDFCQTSVRNDTTLIPLGKDELKDEYQSFQDKVDKLKSEMNEWERKMDEGDMKRDDILSYMALIRTLMSSITENLDNHFYELQTYRRKMMECSVDDLTDRVQKELLLSAKLDNNLLSNLHSANLSHSEAKNSTDVLENHELFPEIGSGDQAKYVTKKKQNLVNLTVKLYELETNLQEMEERNKEFEREISELKNEKNEEKKRADGLQILAKLLEDGLSKEKEKLAEEKSRYDEDAKLMEVLRINFEMILEKADELEKALSIERQHRRSLEKQLNLAQEPNNLSTNIDIASELKCQLEIERKRNSSLGISIEKEKKKCQELKIQLEQEKLERMTEKDVQRLMNKDLTLLQEQKNNLDSQLLYARELLLTREAEIVALKRKINLQEIDIKALTISNESQMEKETEMSMMVEKIGRMEEEIEFYREQMQTLKEKSDGISAPLLMKMKTLYSCVQQHVQESNVMGEALLHLTQEMDQMQTFIKKLEETTENGGGTVTNSSEDTILADFEIERKLFSKEKEKLTSELKKAKCDYEVLKKDSLDIFKSNDSLKLEIKKLNKDVEMLKDELAKSKQHQVGIPEDRVLHLFGKFMRTESYRKALAYQKMYLIKVVKGYEATENDIRLSQARRRELKKKKSPKIKKKFKKVVLMVIAIKRMQFMVSRWRLGRMSGFNALMGHCDAINLNKDGEFRTHSPVSTQIGQINPLRYLTQNLRQQQRPQTQANILRTPPSRDLDSHQNSALDARKIIENIQRFNHLQKNLGLPSRPP